MLQSPEVRRLRICLYSTTCPSHPCIRQRRRRSRDRKRICNSCSSALPISDLEWASPFLHPGISSSDEGESQQLRRRASSCDSFRKRGLSRFRTEGYWSRNSNHPISCCHIRRYRSFSLQISPGPGTQTQTPRLLLGQGSSPRRRRRRYAINLRRS
jgi:hypothetical protein